MSSCKGSKMVATLRFDAGGVTGVLVEVDSCLSVLHEELIDVHSLRLSH